MTATNPHMERARRVKADRFVVAIMRQAKHQVRPFTWTEIADFLETRDEEIRARYARSIGERPASPETWALVVAKFREYAAASQMQQVAR